MNPNVRHAYERIDVALKDLVRRARRGGASIACRHRCDACCYDVTWAHAVEARELAERVRSMPTKTREAVYAALDAWTRGMAAAGLDSSEILPDLRTYHRARLACPLLDPEKHECRVYELRPIACRCHFAVAPDASPCANRAEQPAITTLDFEEGHLAAMALALVGRSSAKGLSPKERADLAGELLPVALARALGYEARAPS